MKRKIIQIDEKKCTGCGLCIDVCAEAALEIVDGKARVVKDFYCDGLGACLDVCPVDALKIIEKDVAEYDPQKTHEHVKNLRGSEKAEKVHGADKIKDEKKEEHPPIMHGCPGSLIKDFRQNISSDDQLANQPGINIKSELRQWPIQMRLLTPTAPYFKNADLVIAADCTPFAYPNFHQKFLKEKILIIFCPKLDEDQDEYMEKLVEIFKTQNIKSITIVHMEVPCCGGVGYLVEQALKKSGQNILVKDYTVSVAGKLI